MRAKIQKIIAALAALAMLVSFAACGGDKKDESTTTAKSNDVVQSQSDVAEGEEDTKEAEGEENTEEAEGEEDTDATEGEESTEAAEGEEDTEAVVENGTTEKAEDETTKKNSSSEKNTTKKDSTEKKTTKKNTTEKKTTKKNTTEKKTTKKNTTTKKVTSNNMPVGEKAIIKYYKEAAAKVNEKKAGYSKTRTSSSDKFEVPFLFKAFKGLIEGFMGMGSKNAYTVDVAKGTYGGKIKPDASGKDQKYYYLSPVTLSESDVEKATCKKVGDNYVITLNLKDGKSAAGKGVATVNKSALDKCGLCVGDRDLDFFDHKTAEIMYSAIEGTFKDTQIYEETDDCVVVAKINASSGKMVSIKVTFDLECDMSVKGSKIEAEGKTVVEFKNFKW